MNKVAISVIIPVYNAEDYLDRCLKSILSQDFSSYEVILVDDGSTDSSPFICDRYSSTDARLQEMQVSMSLRENTLCLSIPMMLFLVRP